MANQTSIRAQTQPGDEIITNENGHIYHYEGGAPAGLSGCSLRLLPGERGLFDADAVRAAIRPTDSHFPRTALVVVENTHNRGGGTCWSIETIAAIRKVADEFGLRMHLDGARLMNACVAKGHSPTEYTRYFDTVSMCFSKGLGAPVGSAVAASAQTVTRIHRFRKMFGGGMRQAGIIAAGALYALDNNIERLADDHANATRLARAIADMPHASIDLQSVETNILYFDVDSNFGSAQKVCDMLREHQVWMLAVSPQRVRAVTHLDVSTEAIDTAITALGNVLGA
jgi:threonine aldolase